MQENRVELEIEKDINKKWIVQSSEKAIMMKSFLKKKYWGEKQTKESHEAYDMNSYSWPW